MLNYLFNRAHRTITGVNAREEDCIDCPVHRFGDDPSAGCPGQTHRHLHGKGTRHCAQGRAGQALGRRAAPAAVTTQLTAGDIEMNLLTREVRRAGQAVLLQPREFRLLEELMRHGGEFVTRTMLLERVWDFHFDPQTKIVETHMSRMRAKLNEGGRMDAIETVRGVGYRIRTA